MFREYNTKIYIIKNFDYRKILNPKTLNKIKKIMGSEYSSKSRSEKIKMTKNLSDLFERLDFQNIHLCTNINNSDIWYRNLKCETILNIFSKLNFEVLCKDVISQNSSLPAIIINLKDGEYLCPKCDGSDSIKLYELNSNVPIAWTNCIYCNFGKIFFTDIIKKGLSK